MTISVVVTVFNLRRFLPETLACLDLQQRQADQIVVVDDHSQDGSWEMLQEWAGRDSRRQLIRQPENTGVMSATLAGLRCATAEVVAFLDGDDLWEPDKLLEVERAFQDPSVTFFSHGYSVIDRWGRRLADTTRDQRALQALADSGKDRLDKVMRRSILRYDGLVWLGSAWCLRRRYLPLDHFCSLLEEVTSATRVYQDHPLATYVALHAPGRFFWSSSSLFRYRVHRANTSADNRSLEKALATSQRSLQTSLLTLHLLRSSSRSDAELEARQLANIADMEFLGHLYRRQWREALQQFQRGRSLGWSLPKQWKESLRLALVLALGPSGFLQLKSRLPQLPALGVLLRRLSRRLRDQVHSAHRALVERWQTRTAASAALQLLGQKPGHRGVFFDCGSNLGQGFEFFRHYFTSAWFDYELFEPNPHCLSSLQALCRGLTDHTIRLHAAAVAVRAGSVPLYGLCESGAFGSLSQGASAFKEHNSLHYRADESSALQVPALDFCDHLKQAAQDYSLVVIKMDIEGGEYELLPELLRQGLVCKIHTLFLEFHSDYMAPHLAPHYRELEASLVKQIRATGCRLVLWH